MNLECGGEHEYNIDSARVVPFTIHDDKARASFYGGNTQRSGSRASRAHSILSHTSQGAQSKRSLGDIGEVDEILDVSDIY